LKSSDLPLEGFFPKAYDVFVANPTGQLSTRFKSNVWMGPNHYFYIQKYVPSQSHGFYDTKVVCCCMHSIDNPFSRLQCKLVEQQCFLSLTSSATMLHFLSMAKYLSKYSPSSTRSRSRWSSSNSEIPSLILSYAFLSSFSSCVLRLLPSGNCGP